MPGLVIQGSEVNYRLAEGPARGQRIVLVHGSGGNAGLWQKVMGGLSGQHSSMAVDLPGHGDSRGQGMSTVPEYRDFLKDFLKALGLSKIVLGGHSLGGAIVQDFALHFPDQLKALLLIGTGARLRVHPDVLENLRKMAEGEIQPKFDPWGFAETAPSEVIAEGERQWARTSPRVRYQDFLACDQFDAMSRIESIRTPSLILCGREDRLTPIKYSEFLNRKIPGSKIAILEGAGHMVMLEAPGALSSAISSFLAAL